MTLSLIWLLLRERARLNVVGVFVCVSSDWDVVSVLRNMQNDDVACDGCGSGWECLTQWIPHV